MPASGRQARGICPECGRLIAVRTNATARAHHRQIKSQRYGPCPGSGEAVVDIREVTRDIYSRETIANEIRKQIFPWTDRPDIWHTIANFVERSGEWMGYSA